MPDPRGGAKGAHTPPPPEGVDNNGKLVEMGKNILSYFIIVFTVFDVWIICDFTPFLTVFQSYQDAARPGIEPRTPDLRVRCLPTALRGPALSLAPG